MTQQKPELQRSFKPASLGTNEEEVVLDSEDDVAHEINPSSQPKMQE